MSDDGPAPAMPRTMREAVRTEFARAFHPPYEAPLVVLINGLLMAAAWFFLPRAAVFRFTGALAFPVLLAGWMYADVPSTNVLAPDRRRVLVALGEDDHRDLRMLLYAKNLVLWLFVTPICMLIAIGIGAVEHKWVLTGVTLIVIALTPLGLLGLAAVLGTYFPYHPQPLRWRWERRDEWKRYWLRWGTLVIAPYMYVPALAAVVALPEVVAWQTLSNKHLTTLTDLDLAIGGLIACAVSVALWFLGHRFVVRLAARRGDKLTSYLADPTRG